MEAANKPAGPPASIHGTGASVSGEDLQRRAKKPRPAAACAEPAATEPSPLGRRPPLRLIPERVWPRGEAPSNLTWYFLFSWLKDSKKAAGTDADAFSESLLEEVGSLAPWFYATSEVPIMFYFFRELLGVLGGSESLRVLRASVRAVAAAEAAAKENIGSAFRGCVKEFVIDLVPLGRSAHFSPRIFYDPGLWEDLGALAPWISEVPNCSSKIFLAAGKHPLCAKRFLTSAARALAEHPAACGSTNAIRNLVAESARDPSVADVLWISAGEGALRKRLLAEAAHAGNWNLARAWLSRDTPSSAEECPVCCHIVGSQGGPPSRQCANGHVVCGSCFDDLVAGRPLLRCPTCKWEAPVASYARSLLADRLGGAVAAPCDCGALVRADAKEAHRLRSCPLRKAQGVYSNTTVGSLAEILRQRGSHTEDLDFIQYLLGVATDHVYLAAPSATSAIVVRITQLAFSETDKTLAIDAETVPGSGVVAQNAVLVGSLEYFGRTCAADARPLKARNLETEEAKVSFRFNLIDLPDAFNAMSFKIEVLEQSPFAVR